MTNTPEFWSPEMLLANIVACAIIALAYFAIPVCLFIFVRKRTSTPLLPVIALFSFFISLLSLGYIFELWSFLHWDQGVNGYIRPIIAVFSLSATFTLIPILKRITSIKSPEEVKALNNKLQDEISTQRAATDKLERTYRELRSYLEQAPEGILIVRASGLIDYSNEMVNTIFGRPSGDLTGKYVRELIPLRSQHKISAHHNELYPTDGTIWQSSGTEFTGVRADGTEFPVEIRVKIISTESDGEVSLSTYRDISDRKQKEEEKRKNHAELAHVSRLSTVGQMATGLAHELNQPLSAISNNLYVAMSLQKKMTAPDPMMQEIIEESYQSAQRAGQIIKSLRQLVSKDESSQQKTDINDLVETTIELIRPEARAAGVKLDLELQAVLPKVLVDHIQIQQVLVNLGRNAIEALSSLDQAAGVVSISTALQNDTILVSVSDNGKGLSADVRNEIFTPNLTTKESGMGLGLSICLSIIEIQGGELWHDEDQSSGATFCFTIPLIKTEDQ